MPHLKRELVAAAAAALGLSGCAAADEAPVQAAPADFAPPPPGAPAPAEAPERGEAEASPAAEPVAPVPTAAPAAPTPRARRRAAGASGRAARAAERAAAASPTTRTTTARSESTARAGQDRVRSPCPAAADDSMSSRVSPPDLRADAPTLNPTSMRA
ncbi:MAG: hypothetical protein M5U28_25435 [Sandaracinaceae bacterium]|nr:hypothetical protein [Sandaracinaceae bacterium]